MNKYLLLGVIIYYLIDYTFFKRLLESQKKQSTAFLSKANASEKALEAD